MPDMKILGAERFSGGSGGGSEDGVDLWHFTNHIWNQASSTAIFIPINTLSEVTSTSLNSQLIMPLAGEITQIDVFCEIAPGNTEITIYEYTQPAGTLSSLDNVTVDIASANVTYSFSFTTATFAARDIISIKFDPSVAPATNPGECRAEVHYKLTAPTS